jgi:hypothetical protein
MAAQSERYERWRFHGENFFYMADDMINGSNDAVTCALLAIYCELRHLAGGNDESDDSEQAESK